MESIPISDIISKPLVATSEAQRQLTQSTVDFIQTIGMETDQSVKTIEFNYNIMNDGVEENIIVKVPLLSILKTPNLSVKSTEIEFHMEINDLVETETESSGNGGLSRYSYYGKLSSKTKSERTTNTSSNYIFKLQATDDGPPEGLSRILDMLNDSIQ